MTTEEYTDTQFEADLKNCKPNCKLKQMAKQAEEDDNAGKTEPWPIKS